MPTPKVTRDIVWTGYLSEKLSRANRLFADLERALNREGGTHHSEVALLLTELAQEGANITREAGIQGRHVDGHYAATHTE